MAEHYDRFDQPPHDAPYRDPDRPIPERVDDLLSRMTLVEKVRQLGCVWSTQLVVDDEVSEEKLDELLGLGTGQVTRIAASTGLEAEGLAEFHNRIQRSLVTRTRLGIPAVIHEESTAGFCARGATQFPQAIGLAATWDPDLVAEIGAVIRRQMLAVGARHTLAPVLDIGRDPRWGRVEETYGEDPELAGRLGVAYVRAVQHDGDAGSLDDGVVCTGKHFLGYGLPDGGLNHGPVQLGPRELREVFAEPFSAAIRDAGLASMMNSYSSIDGLPPAGSAQILTGLLRDELGFEGTVVADYFAVEFLRTQHRTAADKAAAARAALSAGLDVELPALDCYATLVDQVADGEVDEALVDRAVRRVLAQKFALGLFERPEVDAAAAPTAFDTAADRALARRAAAEAVVVLTNDGVLPLGDAPGRIAVIGPAADEVRLTQGDYHYPAHLEIIYEAALAQGLPQSGGAFAPGPYYPETVTPLDALRARYGDAVVGHARGCDLTGDDTSGFAAATRLATDADVAIVVVGGRCGLTPTATVGEARDAAGLGLTGPQPALVEAVAGTGTPTVVVVMSGRVHALEAESEAANSLVLAWPGGEEAGSGLVDVLSGDQDAVGRLPVSVPRRTGQVPVHHGHRAGGGRSQFWGDYADGPAAPLFRFGHGLGWSTFEHTGLEVTAGDTTGDVTVEVTTANTGGRAGVDVVQLYVRDEVASVARPERQLVGWGRVPLAPGERKRVRFVVHPSKLAFYDEAMRFVCEPGEFRCSVGRSAADLTVDETVVLDGEVVEYRQREVVATAVEVLPI